MAWKYCKMGYPYMEHKRESDEEKKRRLAEEKRRLAEEAYEAALHKIKYGPIIFLLFLFAFPFMAGESGCLGAFMLVGLWGGIQEFSEAKQRVDEAKQRVDVSGTPELSEE